MRAKNEWMAYIFSNNISIRDSLFVLFPESDICPTQNVVTFLPRTMCCTPSNIEICSGLLTPCRSNILNSGIPSKPRLRVRFGSTMMKYTFTLPLPELGAKVKVMHSHTMGQT